MKGMAEPYDQDDEVDPDDDGDWSGRDEIVLVAIVIAMFVLTVITVMGLVDVSP